MHACYYVEQNVEFSTGTRTAYLADRVAGNAGRESDRRRVQLHSWPQASHFTSTVTPPSSRVETRRGWPATPAHFGHAIGKSRPLHDGGSTLTEILQSGQSITTKSLRRTTGCIGLPHVGHTAWSVT
jgi:hypothetical protein